MENIWLEVFGYFASLVVVCSFGMTSVKKLRVINGVGAFLSLIYGVLIVAYPVALMNAVIFVLDAVQFFRLVRVKNSFDIVPACSDAAYFKWFVERYKDDIKNFDESLKFETSQHIFYYIRDNEVAGILSYNELASCSAEITLDYVLPKYRDFKIGNYFFGKDHLLFSEAGICEFVTRTRNPVHEKYLRRLHFERQSTGEWKKSYTLN